MTLPERDYSKLFPGGVCVICQQPRTPEGYADHAAHHLADCSVVVVVDYSTKPPSYRVVPTESIRQNTAELSPMTVIAGARRPDSKLIALAKAALRRSTKGRAS